MASAHVPPEFLGFLVPAPQIERGTIQVHKMRQHDVTYAGRSLCGVEVADMPNWAYFVSFVPLFKTISHGALQLSLYGQYHKLARIVRLLKGLFEKNRLEGVKASKFIDSLQCAVPRSSMPLVNPQLCHILCTECRLLPAHAFLRGLFNCIKASLLPDFRADVSIHRELGQHKGTLVLNAVTFVAHCLYCCLQLAEVFLLVE